MSATPDRHHDRHHDPTLDRGPGGGGGTVSARPYGPGPGASVRTGPARGLVTAEAVELEIPTASVGLRGLAALIDVVVLGVLTVVVFLATSALLTTLVGAEDGQQAVAVVAVVTLSTLVVVPTVVEATTRGRSLGKLVARLRVVTVEAGPVTWRQAAVRAAAGAFEIYATFGLVALLVALVSARGQRLGDMVAGTVVVREAVSRADIRPVRFRAVPGTEDLAAGLDTTALADPDYQVIRTTLLRTGLEPERHARVCAVVVRRVWSRVSGLPLPTTIPAPAVLTAIAAAYQDQHAPTEAGRATDWVWSH